MMWNMNIKTRLTGTFILLAVFVAMIGLVGMYYTDYLGERGKDIGFKIAPVGDAVIGIKVKVTQSHLWFEEILFGDVTEDVQYVFNLMDEALWFCDAILSGGANDIGTFYASEDPRVLKKVRQIKNNLKEVIGTIYQRYDVPKGEAIAESELDQFLDSQYKVLMALTDEAEMLIKDNMHKATEDLALANVRVNRALIAISIFAMLVALALGLFVSGSIIRPLGQMVRVADSIAQGNLDQKIEVMTKDELGILAVAFNNMVKQLRAILNKNKQEDWFKTGLNELNMRIRGDQDFKSLTKNALNFFAVYLNSQVGVFYLTQEDERLKLVSSYAYKILENDNYELKFGESLIGQAALEKKNILFTPVPEDHISMKIDSGMGDSVPESIFVVPFVYLGNVLGVMALGVSRQFNTLEKEFLDRAAESMAIVINSARSRLRTQELLAETQQQSEELETQQEELRQTNEELQDQTQRLRASEESLQAQQEELKVSNEEMQEKTELLEKQKQEIMSKNIELELNTKYKSEFLANMSHELRTPLNSLMLLSKNLAKNKHNNLTETQVKDAEVIFGSGKDLLDLIDGVLDLSKIESGKTVLNLENVFYSEVIQSVETAFKHIAKAKGLAFSFSVDKALASSLYTDRQKFEQIIKNLVSNAIKFTGQGSVKIDFRRPSAMEIPEGVTLNREDAVAVSVADTGIGIPADKHFEIFEAFQQVDGTISRKYGGTGLGLSIVRELSRLLGGEVMVQSVPEKGATFTVVVSRHIKTITDEDGNHREVQQIKVVPKSVTRIGIEDDRDSLKEGDRIILIIEDDLRFARILYDLCHEKDFKCVHAFDGENGLELIEEVPVNAIILDIKLPGLNGWGVLRKLKNNFKTRHIPVHIISVNDEPKNVFKKGVVGYLKKPASHEDLDKAFACISELIFKKVKKLLIVDDDCVTSQVLQKMFHSTNVDIEMVTQGWEALKKIKEKKYDCVILDLVLPDMSGFELLRKFDTLDPSQLPTVIVNAERALTQEECFELNKYASSIITKGSRSQERLLDETALFLHTIVADMINGGRKMITRRYERNNVFRGKKIMVVDDDMRNIYAIITLLEGASVEIIKAFNGAAALEELNKHPDVDLILMDIMMPVMDGHEAIRQIRKDPRFRTLPILALTAKAMKQDRDLCFEVGATDYLVKPIDPDALISALSVWLYSEEDTANG